MKLEFSRQVFEKFSNIKFHANPSNGGRTDRHDMPNFANSTSQGDPEVKRGSTMASGGRLNFMS